MNGIKATEKLAGGFKGLMPVFKLTRRPPTFEALHTIRAIA